MFRPTSSQSSLFEVENYFPGALPKEDWCFTYQKKVLPLIDEEKFRHLYSESEGCPNASIITLVSLIDHTTLFKFYQRLEIDDTARTLFTEITDAFVKACGTSLKKQRTDSFFIHGWLRLLSRYGLFKETIRKFLQSLRKQKPGL